MIAQPGSIIRDLPPLNALRVFEVAAKNESFRRAAEELSMSIGSVSRFIAQLESDLELKLFERHARGVRLTLRGREYFDDIHTAFDQLRISTQRQRPKSSTRKSLVLWVTQAVGSLWLMPRVERLRQKIADIDLRLMVSTEFPDVQSGRVDFAMAPDYKQQLEAQALSSTALYRECLTLVCSPALLNGEKPVTDLVDIPDSALLVAQSMVPEWRKWLQAGNLAEIALQRGTDFETSLGALQAAGDGLGFALGERVTTHQQLLNGDLVAPFSNITVSGQEVKLYWRRGAQLDDAATEIADVIKTFVAESLGPGTAPFSTDWLNISSRGEAAKLPS